MEGYLGHVQGKALERGEGKKVRVLVVRWNDEDGRRSERWSQGLRIDVAEHDMRVERCHIKLWPF
jgi:hypothetical protein